MEDQNCIVQQRFDDRFCGSRNMQHNPLNMLSVELQSVQKEIKRRKVKRGIFLNCARQHMISYSPMWKPLG